MPLYSNIYQDLAVVESIVIGDGQTESPLINCAALSNGSGCGVLRRITLPTGFPEGGTITFVTIENPLDVDFADLFLSDGVNESLISLPVAVTGNPKSIALPAVAFDSVRLFKIISSSPMVGAQTVKLIFEPIYQGTA